MAIYFLALVLVTLLAVFVIGRRRHRGGRAQATPATDPGTVTTEFPGVMVPSAPPRDDLLASSVSRRTDIA